MVKQVVRKIIYFVVVAFILVQCKNEDFGSINSTSEPVNQQTVTSVSTNTSQIGCFLPPVQVSNNPIQYFYWGDDSETIIFQEKSEQNWYGYGITTGQVNSIYPEISLTSATVDISAFDLQDYADVFVSPNRKVILFTRGTPEKLGLYYKFANEKREYGLGIIQGYIKSVNWLNKDNTAIIVMDWQAVVSPEASVYTIDFSENELTIEIPLESDYKNIEYLGLTPDETRFLFVSYLNKAHLDRTVKVWSISTHEVSSTPILNPLDFRWVSESEFISISPNPDMFSNASILLYDINNSKLTQLSEHDIKIAPFTPNAVQISPNGTSIAFIEDETDHLYWFKCRY